MRVGALRGRLRPPLGQQIRPYVSQIHLWLTGCRAASSTHRAWCRVVTAQFAWPSDLDTHATGALRLTSQEANVTPDGMYHGPQLGLLISKF